MGNNIFVLHTMHHINLAISLIKKEGYKNNILVLFDTFKINYDEVMIIKKYFKIVKIFDKHSNEKFNNKHSFLEWYNKLIFNHKQANEFDNLLKELKGYEFKKIFFGNNTGIEVQILINQLKSNSCDVIYIEDGSAAYHDAKYIEKKFIIKKILKPNYLIYNIKYKYFKRFTNNSSIGVADYVKSGYYLHKDYIREELKSIEANKIDLESYKNVLLEFNNTDYRVNNSIFIIMELSDNGHIDTSIGLIKYIKKSKCDIYIKYHPREHNFYADYLLDNQVKRIESNLNVENILVNTENNIILGNGSSTAFLILPLISKNIFIMTNKIFNVNINKRYLSILKENSCIEIDKIDYLDKYIYKERE